MGICSVFFSCVFCVRRLERNCFESLDEVGFSSFVPHLRRTYAWSSSLRGNGFVIVCINVLLVRILYNNMGMNCVQVSVNDDEQMFGGSLLCRFIGMPVRARCTVESEKQEGDFEILLLLVVIVALIDETMDQDAMKKKITSFKMGDMIRSV